MATTSIPKPPFDVPSSLIIRMLLQRHGGVAVFSYSEIMRAREREHQTPMETMIAEKGLRVGLPDFNTAEDPPPRELPLSRQERVSGLVDPELDRRPPPPPPPPVDWPTPVHQGPTPGEFGWTLLGAFIVAFIWFMSSDAPGAISRCLAQ